MPRTREITYGAKTLKEFLEKNMYNDEFNCPIDSDLGWTKAALTWACNSPETLSFKKVKQLAVFLFRDERQAAMLHEFFGAGKDKITTGDLETLQITKPEPQP